MRDIIPDSSAYKIAGVDLSEQGDMTVYASVKVSLKGVCLESAKVVGTIYDKEATP